VGGGKRALKDSSVNCLERGNSFPPFEKKRKDGKREGGKEKNMSKGSEGERKEREASHVERKVERREGRPRECFSSSPTDEGKKKRKRCSPFPWQGRENRAKR